MPLLQGLLFGLVLFVCGPFQRCQYFPVRSLPRQLLLLLQAKVMLLLLLLLASSIGNFVARLAAALCPRGYAVGQCLVHHFGSRRIAAFWAIRAPGQQNLLALFGEQ